VLVQRSDREEFMNSRITGAVLVAVARFLPFSCWPYAAGGATLVDNPFVNSYDPAVAPLLSGGVVVRGWLR
jgi:hypothetical protein